mmetsp:Transcript_109377/g.310146  ORF Transcript_109377/g.310146 Transcript_109377/m.310146 type:complete len:312 (-) Transcript_109377:425-1360(-)
MRARSHLSRRSWLLEVRAATNSLRTCDGLLCTISQKSGMSSSSTEQPDFAPGLPLALRSDEPCLLSPSALRLRSLLRSLRGRLLAAPSLRRLRLLFLAPLSSSLRSRSLLIFRRLLPRASDDPPERDLSLPLSLDLPRPRSRSFSRAFAAARSFSRSRSFCLSFSRSFSRSFSLSRSSSFCFSFSFSRCRRSFSSFSRCFSSSFSLSLRFARIASLCFSHSLRLPFRFSIVSRICEYPWWIFPFLWLSLSCHEPAPEPPSGYFTPHTSQMSSPAKSETYLDLRPSSSSFTISALAKYSFSAVSSAFDSSSE